MPDIDPAALSRHAPSSLSTPLPPSKPLSTTPSSSKPPKTVSTAQRIDLEPLYTALKHAIGPDNWPAYKESTTLFFLGHLNQRELAARIDPFLLIDAAILHHHNQLLSALYGNVTRDLPDHQGVAGFVSANDKPSLSLLKPISGDAAEQRLKTEVKHLPARDRRRLKDIPEDGPGGVGDEYRVLAAVRAEREAKGMRIPDMVPSSGGGHNKTNYDLSIRRRYLLPLSTETLEFPDPPSLLPRLTPLCHEAGLPSPPPDPSSIAAFLAVATETFIKELLANVFAKTRSDAPGIVQTARYKKRLRREEEQCNAGEGGVTRDGGGLLPLERERGGVGRTVGMGDLRMGWELGGGGAWGVLGGGWPLGAGGGGWGEDEAEVVFVSADALGTGDGKAEDGAGGLGDPMDVDPDEGDDAQPGVNMEGLRTEGDGEGEDEEEEEDTWGWEGGGVGDREALGGLLDECLTVG